MQAKMDYLGPEEERVIKPAIHELKDKTSKSFGHIQLNGFFFWNG